MRLQDVRHSREILGETDSSRGAKLASRRSRQKKSPAKAVMAAETGGGTAPPTRRGGTEDMYRQHLVLSVPMTLTNCNTLGDFRHPQNENAGAAQPRVDHTAGPTIRPRWSIVRW